MTRLLVAALLLAGLSAPTGLAATPAWTAKGAITVLHPRSITVAGRTCRITAASPAPTTLRLFYVGAEARIVCSDGVLHTIGVLHQLPPVIVTAPARPSGSTLTAGATPSSSLSMSQTELGFSGSGSSITMTGSFPITALGMSITAGLGTLLVTCSIGDSSPDVSGFQIGDHLSGMQCQSGVLTSITRRG